MRTFRHVFVLIAATLLLAGCMSDGSVSVGARSPVIKTKTLKDVDGDFSRITTYRYPDKRMYRYSLDEALAMKMPILLEFATPGHCTVCDKQLQMIKGLLAKYDGKVLFLHMDQYENPEAFIAFGVIGDPWTYVIDSDQVVRFKQPGRMLYGEMEAQLKRVTAPAKSSEQS